MSRFVFDTCNFDAATHTASFRYFFEDGLSFEEKVTFAPSVDSYDRGALERALFLAFVLIGTSYYKTAPTREVSFAHHQLDDWQARFFSTVYQEGLSQFAYENSLTRADLATFHPTVTDQAEPHPYTGNGTLALQSGGKDSLLTATLLAEKHQPFTPWYISSGQAHPAILDSLADADPLAQATRQIDRESLKAAAAQGALNGHVPVTYIVQSLALAQAILLGKHHVLVSIGHEGEEPHAWIDDLPVNHQWSKTWSAEQQFADYVKRYISPDIVVGSPLRAYSELKVSELFVRHCWETYGHAFSSCNHANYRQGADNTVLAWCGQCPKCANSYLLFAPFVEAGELQSLFADKDLFTSPVFTETFKGLLGIDGIIKPFECVGEVGELRLAYHRAQAAGGFAALPFVVPRSDFDYEHRYPSQSALQLG